MPEHQDKKVYTIWTEVIGCVPSICHVFVNGFSNNASIEATLGSVLCHVNEVDETRKTLLEMTAKALRQCDYECRFTTAHERDSLKANLRKQVIR